MTQITRGLVLFSVPLLWCVALGACHLVDQRDFNANAGRAPKPPAGKPGPALGPQALLRIAYDTPDPDYAPALAQSVQRALTLKPGVLFTVQTLVPLSATPDAQQAALSEAASTAREIDEAIVTDGADQGQVELAIKTDPGVHVKEVRIFVH